MDSLLAGWLPLDSGLAQVEALARDTRGLFGPGAVPQVALLECGSVGTRGRGGAWGGGWGGGWGGCGIQKLVGCGLGGLVGWGWGSLLGELANFAKSSKLTSSIRLIVQILV